MHNVVLGTPGVPEMFAGLPLGGLLVVGWVAWSNNQAARLEDHRGDPHRAERSGEDEYQAFGRK